MDPYLAAGLVPDPTDPDDDMWQRLQVLVRADTGGFERSMEIARRSVGRVMAAIDWKFASGPRARSEYNRRRKARRRRAHR